MSAAREQILERIAATGTAGASARSTAHDYQRSGTLGPDERSELFCRRVSEYRAEVRRVTEAELARAVSLVCAARGATRLVAPAGIPSAWRPADVELVDDHQMSARELDLVDGALTGCTAAIAETGTIVLTAGPAEGRRALSLVPDLHVCVVGEPQIVELLPEALATLAEADLQRRPLTFISGPSATSDIELSRVEGVHGPRDLIVLVVKEPS
jgi:L-lactate dehydrogenase complex protein LldG